MSHKLSHTICRNGAYYYNRRVPKCAIAGFGQEVVRHRLGRDPVLAEELSKHLTMRLDAIWSASVVRPVSIEGILLDARPQRLDLLEAVDLYLASRSIDEKPIRLAAEALVRVAGNKDVSFYDRRDARLLVHSLQDKGNKSATVRRRVQSLHALLELGYLEKDETKRNPFARLSIPGEGRDALKRGVFSEAQLRVLYSHAFSQPKDTRLVLPILGETGARLSEIVGLRWSDVDVNTSQLIITPHEFRRLKTSGSDRAIPLVSVARCALEKLRNERTCETFVFPRWWRQAGFVSTHASNTLNKHIAKSMPGLTCHCFRHTMRDRLRNAGAPSDLIDQIGGWSSARQVGVQYGHGYSVEVQRNFMRKIEICL